VRGLFRLAAATAMPELAHQPLDRAPGQSIPSRLSSRQTFRAPYTPRPFSFQTRMIFFFSSSSRASRAGGFSSRFFAA
jgi:hypothetical protein